VHRHCVTDVESAVTHELRTISIDNLCVSVLWGVCHILGERNTKQSTPLLQLLAQVGDLDQRVSSTVPGRHAGVSASVAGVHGLDLGNPFSLRLDDLAVGASRVCGAGAGTGAASNTACGDTRVACSRGDDVWVGSHHDVGHHASGTASSDEDLGRVGIVLLDGVLDHVVQALVIAAGIARETLGSVDFPAVVVFLGGGEDVNEALLLGQAVVLGGLRVGFSSATAVVKLLVG
jgi:hypothetical protein